MLSRLPHRRQLPQVIWPAAPIRWETTLSFRAPMDGPTPLAAAGEVAAPRMGGIRMARRSRRNVVSSLYDLMKTLFQGPKDSTSKQKRRGFGFETLEGRAMLATDFGAITGLVYRDANNNGFTAGEEVSGATVNLYTDDGDSVFEPGAGDALTDTDATNASGQ